MECRQMTRLIDALMQFKLRCRLAREVYAFWRALARHNASWATERSLNKTQYTLLREAHVIEKGLSLRHPRRGFGQQKILALLGKIENYLASCAEADAEFVRYPISVVGSYVEYSVGTGSANADIEARFRRLATRAGTDFSTIKSGVRDVTRDQIHARCNSDFESLLFSRHSVRYFATELPSRDLIHKALGLAQQTPSACNRQGWRTHVFFGESSRQMATWQGGASGFEDEVRCCILVTGDMNAFLLHEIHQVYVDGGMYAMNLLNALHSVGLGTVPLSCGFYHGKLAAMKKMFKIPTNEVPILIVGVGCLEERFRVAVSARKSVNVTNTHH
jgi:nitroreductase